jgi:hypothetical protein
MKFVLLVLFSASLAGCATHDQKTIASVRASGVSERTVAKLEHRGVLAPNDLIELEKRGVSDAVPIRLLDKVGVDYVVQKDDMRRLRSAGVSSEVRDALAEASREFVHDRYAPRPYYEIGFDAPWHYGARWWWPYADVSLGYSWGHWRCR